MGNFAWSKQKASFLLFDKGTAKSPFPSLLKKRNQLLKQVSSTASKIFGKSEPSSLGKDVRKPFSTYCDMLLVYTRHSGLLSTFSTLTTFFRSRKRIHSFCRFSYQWTDPQLSMDGFSIWGMSQRTNCSPSEDEIYIF